MSLPSNCYLPSPKTSPSYKFGSPKSETEKDIEPSKIRISAGFRSFQEVALLDCCFQGESAAFTAASDCSITSFKNNLAILEQKKASERVLKLVERKVVRTSIAGAEFDFTDSEICYQGSLTRSNCLLICIQRKPDPSEMSNQAYQRVVY
ncbi:hypothetical protein L6452_18547 [Arctium lappa]|uniref:Uncharacterized protein n=1 Tax=Arctium lappa TaxID=4217 RepID=A0ACB9C6P7_ARCLA|nr:hypothetical protein L6452_18547 [Arctium lappa]